MPQITFHNVNISILAANGKEAYTKLCNLLDTLGDDLDFDTDTYTVDDGRPGRPVFHDTTELWPTEDEQAKPYSVTLADTLMSTLEAEAKAAEAGK